MAPAASKPVIPQNDNVAHALAGAGGGVLSMILTYPLITLSTRAQVESTRGETPFMTAVKRIIAREGVSGLYAGLDSAVFGISVTNFVYYYWYEWTRAFFEAAAVKAGRASSKLTTVESMMAGALAGSATVILTNPIWVPDHHRHPARLLKEEGPQALFRGVVPALVLVINPILQYTLFEQMKNVVEKKRRITPGVAFVLGALGKLFATSITYPYITVKSQMHVAGNGQREGMGQAISRVIKEEGYKGLYKGIAPKVTQSVLTAAFLFAFKDVLYEQTVRLRGTAAKKALA
ncbi:hypothetical protein G7054_g7462 [Neopestalotiopsis clavispora]|nr:hypothetical protein G7054_g7462 [Neopestalotiopsis clavispora]